MSTALDLPEAPADAVEVLGQNALRVKVAELCGWKQLSPNHWQQKIGEHTLEHFECPDYPNDLNACAEFEKTLDADQCVTYVRHLDEMHETSTLTKIWSATVKGDQNELYYEAFALVSATATQRCQAFVKTMEGKS